MAGMAGALLTYVAFVADGRDKAEIIPNAITSRDQGLSGPGEICRAPSRLSRKRVASAASAQATTGAQPPLSPDEFADVAPPLWDDLGTLTYPITTASADAQKFFDQGLRLAYAFNHAEAQRAFRKAQNLDPGCAMCFWGEALVLGPNVNMPMDEEAVAPAFAALSKAQAVAERASPRERALITALSKRYAEDPKADRPALDQAYAAAMREVAAQYPDDLDIAVLYAEALMNLSPADYWESDGSKPKASSADIVPTLERLLARKPDHPGAIHYYIHAVEDSDRPERAERYADRLRGAMPGAGHLAHMPSHIYYKIGRYQDALAVNREAVAADVKYIEHTNAPLDTYRVGYYPHNVRYVLGLAQMAGDVPTLMSAAEKLTGLVPGGAALENPHVQPMIAALYFAHALFSSAPAVLSLPEPDDAMPLVKAIWHYARGVAQVRHGDVNAARREADAIEALERTADFAALTAVNIQSDKVLRIAVHVIHGRIAQAEGNHTAAIERLEAAAALQDTLPSMEPPYWYHWPTPVRQSLGAVLLQAGRLDEAERQFQLTLEQAPNNAWSHFGLAELYKARGDIAAQKRAEQALTRNWVGDRQFLRLSDL
jgi:tetratricopeptide (TPR) repeat protein